MLGGPADDAPAYYVQLSTLTMAGICIIESALAMYENPTLGFVQSKMQGPTKVGNCYIACMPVATRQLILPRDSLDCISGEVTGMLQ